MARYIGWICSENIKEKFWSDLVFAPGQTGPRISRDLVFRRPIDSPFRCPLFRGAPPRAPVFALVPDIQALLMDLERLQEPTNSSL